MVKRRSRPTGTPVIILALLVLTVGGGLLNWRATGIPRCPVRAATVVLDPGHGGNDPGAVNEAAGLVERDLTLDIAERAAALLRADGYGVALTRRDNETALGNSERGRIANACGALAFVSIHLNSFSEPEPNYAKTFWGVEDKDAAFAAAMQGVLAAELRPGTDLGDSGTEQFESGALLRARMPAALLEPVFLSNPAEAARLADPSGARLDQIAEAIVRGVEDWLGPHLAGRPGPQPGIADRALLRAADTLLGPPRGTAEQAIGAAEAARALRMPEVQAYVTEVYRLAPRVGLDPAIVVAQSAHETAFWRSPAWVDHLNPAGIGITGPEVPSPTWESGTDAARAHLVHVYLYAVGEIGPDHPLSPYRTLDPRYEAALGAGRAGSSKTIADLAGRWATDPHYAEGVARVGNELFGRVRGG